MKIGLLEDELMLREAIREYLEATGYRVDVYEDGLEAYEAMRQKRYDLYILDINTPGIDGLSLLERLQREKIFVPTIFISAITQIEQISRAYELGCYDYLKKPFHLKELTLHIERLLKIADLRACSLLRITSMYSYDLERRRLIFDGEDQPLTQRQTQIVDLLASNLGHIIGFDTLRHRVWDDSEVDNATIRAEMHRVRKALKEEIIESVKGVGYRMVKN
ncbi:two component transcriptional regulator, winged helix family [Nitratifractor salsuginis DSM 16511]|uniref:Two component transcriptional regulator, winged helix family n=1 Tax=Nitratifractor salsuginis (strain DSM 16511 / JCM 12458 / E9I37-1) TaxID=749222 RepID=E6WXR2_NITSE|nr:response regulator transcription factor [Nitratifractor salsuginis]ADV46319.1 two component transcriptional regulator, winged helix family [Nitratifractor salsuginis DSM 16511]